MSNIVIPFLENPVKESTIAILPKNPPLTVKFSKSKCAKKAQISARNKLANAVDEPAYSFNNLPMNRDDKDWLVIANRYKLTLEERNALKNKRCSVFGMYHKSYN